LSKEGQDLGYKSYQTGKDLLNNINQVQKAEKYSAIWRGKIVKLNPLNQYLALCTEIEYYIGLQTGVKTWLFVTYVMNSAYNT
jgi:hypothetical protein